MKIAVISDIHGNALALDTVLHDLQGEAIDQIVCLGDAIQGGPQPAQTMSMLRDLGCPVVMGNSDSWLLKGPGIDNEHISPEVLHMLETVREWSLGQLSEADCAFIRAFQPTIEIPLGEGPSLLCFHGSPTWFEDVIARTTPDEEVLAKLEPYLPRFMAGGHTHAPQVRYLGKSDSFFFNPGSVGVAHTVPITAQTYRASPWAEYAILTADKGRLALDFRRVSYDPNALIDIYRKSGRPYLDEAIEQYGG